MSYTAWKRWCECPMMERLLREGAPRISKERRNFLVGDVMHDALERTVRERSVPTPDRVANDFNREAAKPGVSFRDLNDRAKLQSKLIDATSQLAPFVLSLVSQADDYKVELELGTMVDHPDLPARFMMTAKFDLVLSWHDGVRDRWAIIDYKSGSRDKGQMHWYHYVWHAAMPDCPANFYFVSPGSEGVERTLVNTTAEDVELALSRARAVAAALMAKDFPARPDTYKCRRCRVRPTCPDSAYSTQRGRLVHPPS